MSRLVSLLFFVFGLGSSFGVGLARGRSVALIGGLPQPRRLLCVLRLAPRPLSPPRGPCPFYTARLRRHLSPFIFTRPPSTPCAHAGPLRPFCLSFYSRGRDTSPLPSLLL
ncbi:hypothetical protein C8J57DRAFT_1321572, partial [Mycena rebaudengoi]